jgi:hypothetical protein
MNLHVRFPKGYERIITDISFIDKRKEGIVPSIYYKWSKAFLEAGKRQLNGDPIPTVPALLLTG